MMKHFYFFKHKKVSSQDLFPVTWNAIRLKKISHLLIVLACFFSSRLLAQTNPPVPFNASFWNGYADKLNLAPKEREEFIYSHQQLESGTLTPVPQATPQTQPTGGRAIGQPNATFAGPCVNADFEAGNLTGWVRSSGFHPGYNPLGCCPNPGGQQTIMSGVGVDPYGGFPLVSPGGNFSLRLGNNATNGQADRIEQTFLVSTGNANFSYKYAVVFEDPNHPASQQPFFQVELLDSLGAAVPCTFYYVAAGQGIPGFFNSTNSGTTGVIYKPWTTVLVDLTPYIGQNITIRFSTYDCSLGGHFGYAYIDGVCQSFSSGGSATVCTGASTTFCAPEGVSSYTWNGPGLTNFVAQCAPASAPGIYTVTTTLFTGCPGPIFTYTLDNQAPPLANAGPDATVCANNNTISLSGSITGFSATPVWSAGAGSGAFTSTSSINTTYTPSAANNAAGSVTLTLTTANNGVCPASTDNLVITITPSPLVNAGTGGSACNTNPFALSGSVTGGASTGTWSTSGDGSFSPANSDLNASYTPGVADIASGSVTLTLTSTNNGNCFPGSDTLIILVRKLPTANAGANQSLCSTTSTIALSGIIGGGSSTGTWSSSGSGGFSPPTPVLNKVYAITPSDITTGEVTFTLTSTNNGPCPAATDTVKMLITKPATVTAGANQFLCSTAGSISLGGSVTSPSNTGNWASSVAGAFNPGSSFLSTDFTPATISAGTIIFTLTSTNNGPCAAVSDTVMMRIRIPATVNAGANQALCSNAPLASLSGTVGGGGSTGIWSGTGAGAFTPSIASLNPAYHITAADVASGSMIFTLTSTNNGPCASEQDSVMVTITNLATLTVGPNQLICSSAGVVNLTTTINSPSNTLTWAANGAGSFAPSVFDFNPTYSLTTADINAGAVTFTAASTNNGPCPAVAASVTVAIKKLAIINAGSSQTICSNSPTLNLSGTIGGGATTVTWTGTGSGAFVPGIASLTTSYGITTADINSGAVTFTLTSTNNGPCPAVSSTVMATITKIATVTAGPNLYVCSNAATLSLAGSVNSPSNTGVWSSNGSGIFLPNATAVANTYSFSAADVAAGTVIYTLTSTNNGVCPAVTDTVKMRLMKLAAVNAGTNQIICSNAGTLALNGTVTGASGTGAWSSNGVGAFNPGSTALNTSYTITQNDITNGQVNFTLSSTGNGPCPVITNMVLVAITKIATVTAGPNLYVCSNASTLSLAGSVNSPSNTGAWSSNGSGIFLPNTTAVANTYSFSAADVAAGTVIYTLTSTNNGVCPAVTDTVKMRIMKLAAVNAGTNQIICSNAGTLALNGTINGASGTGIWSSDGIGAFNPGSTALNTSYTITQNDITNGQVNFTLSSTGNGPCPVVTNTVSVVISPIATVSAGSNQYICSSQNSITLSSTVTGVTSTGQWGASGTGNFLPGNTALAGAYSLTATDITNGTIIFTLTSTNNGVCPAISDTVKMRVMKQATVNAGLNQALCSNISTLALNGTIAGASGTGSWLADGPGSFVPGNTLPATAYSITPADVTSGQVIFTLTSTGNGPCPAISDTVKITIKTIATVSAGINQQVCSSQNSLTLNGTISGGTSSGQWAATGAGGFTPGNTNLAASYSLTGNDISVGTIIFTLTSTNNGVCPAVSDTVKMRVIKQATVNAGNDQVLCSNVNTISLAGTVYGASGTGAWAASGAGAFIPGNMLWVTSYSITPTDISNGLVNFTLSSTANGPCPAISSAITVTIRTLATVNAGVNQVICASQNVFVLNGNISGVTATGQWASSGSGSFSPINTSMGASYSLTAADLATGAVVFTLSSTGNGVCPVVKDTVKMKVIKQPTVNAGPNLSVCSSQGIILLNGSVTGGSNSGSWTGAGGSFIPGPGNVNTSYQMTAQNISAGIVVFTLSSQNSGPCPEATDTTAIVIQTPAQVSAGASQTICSSTGTVNLPGTITGGMGAVNWTSSGGGFFNPTNNSPVTAYVISPSDVAAGAVSFTLVSTNNGSCAKSTATLAVSVKQLAHVSAGADKSICSTQLQVPLQGVISGVTNTGAWTSTGTGTLSPNQPAGNYSVSTADISQGNIDFVLTSSNNDVCPVVTDTMKLTIVQRPVIAVSADTTICEKHTLIAISGTIISAGSGTPHWTTSGSGSFLPANSLSATHYSLSAADRLSGNVALVLDYPSAGTCSNTGGTMLLHILPVPSAAFSASEYTVQLPGNPVQFNNASISATGYAWSFGDGDTSSVTDPTHNYSTVGFYHAMLVALGNNGCADTTEQLITVVSDTKFPTAFTPNIHGGNGGYYNKDDLSNDVFFPYTQGVVEANLMIFNRWGELIFKSTDVNVGWDGYFNGKLCQQDAYVWKADFVFFDGRKYSKTGSITLLR